MTDRQRIYLDTSVISALLDHRNPERMELTKEFMASSDIYDIYISEITTAELERTPDEHLRAAMKSAIHDFQVLPGTDDGALLAEEYIRNGAIPESHPEDAYHIAIAVLANIGFLLSWNFKHIVRLKTRRIVQTVNASRGLSQINILTPAEML